MTADSQQKIPFGSDASKCGSTKITNHILETTLQHIFALLKFIRNLSTFLPLKSQVKSLNQIFLGGERFSTMLATLKGLPFLAYPLLLP